MMRERMSSRPYPKPSSTAITAAMRGNRRRDTRPERRLRSCLHAMGLRYRVDLPIQAGDVRVRPDVVFRARQVAVFVDGCFFHRCPEHGTTPRSNSWYWGPKLDRNVARDQRIDAALQALGWIVIRVWEHEAPAQAATRIAAAVQGSVGR
jgi:DNA mismatch endonuclease (patch repair protein)